MRNLPGKRVPLSFLIAAVLWTGLPALAGTDGPYDVEILVDGVPLREIRARGASYVEAIRGAEYAVRLHNRSGNRVAVALAVDGLNTIDARHTTARDARKWVLGPWESVTLEGWQTGRTTARRFVFTTEDDSYGAWIGHTDDLGSITAAFFREVRSPRPPVPLTEAPSPESREDAGAAGRPQGPAAESRWRRSDSARKLSQDHAATGIGRELDHRVRTVAFHAEPAPAAVIRLRYEYRDGLVRLGVLPEDCAPLDRRERSRGFADLEFAPDPYRHR